MLSDTNGGFEPSDVTEEAVKPIGIPASVEEVTTVIPDAWFRNTAFRAADPVRSKLGDLSFMSR
jgi:hypothetical protein